MLSSTRLPAIPLSLPILVIEDNPDQQLLFGHNLRLRIPQVTATFQPSAVDALNYLKDVCAERPRQFPQLVLLDLHLPELWQGWQALTEIRAYYPRLPVVVMTYMPRQELVDKSYDLGAHSFLTKPTSLDDWAQQFSSLGNYWLNTVTLATPC